MKNGLHSAILIVALLSIGPDLLLGQNSTAFKVKATGTGQTTGHIANLSIQNNGALPLNIKPESVYIPSDGQYQPYVVEIPGITIPPGETADIPVDGYCADIFADPVPSGTSMPPLGDWIPIGSGTSLKDLISIIPHISQPPFTPGDIPMITGSPGYTPRTTPTTPEIIPTWPGTDQIVGGTISPKKDPDKIAPVLIEAIHNIAKAYDKLRDEGKIATPFSGNLEKEREAVIQQTFWIYTASLSGKKYEKETFRENTIKQFEANTGTPLATLPEKEKEDMNSGIAEFWNTFTAVGTEAKVLSKDGMSNAMNEPELIADKAPLVTIVDQISQADQFKKELKKCFFNKLEYDVFILHAYDRGTGNKKKHSRDEYAGNEKNEAELPLQKGDSLEVNLENLKCECLCWTAQEKGGKKTGTFCDCEITGVSLRSYNGQAFTDLMEADFDKYVTATLRKEVAEKLDALKKANGKKSEIDKLQKQLDDEKKLIKENADRIAELKKQLNGPWRLAHDKTQTAFQVKAGFTGQVEFVFDVQGKCKGDDTCAGCEFSREVKFKVNVPKS
jgi:hypothetical protein